MQKHPEGLQDSSFLSEPCGSGRLILKHHKRWDGNGYPLGLRGEQIPLEFRILAIIDAYDAMVSDRPYSTANTKDHAITELMKGTDTQFNPRLVETFLAVLSEEDN